MPPDERRTLAAELNVVTVRMRETMWLVDEQFSHVFFPIDAVFSIVAGFGDGQVAEVSTIGNESLFPLAVAAGISTSRRTATCRIGGRCARLSRATFHAALDRLPALRRLVQRTMYSRLFIAEQLLGCNLTHNVLERSARWLLSTEDRVGRSDFWLTHEFLALMLGARRPAVTEAAGELQRAGAISYHRGHIAIVDSGKTHRAACECYAIARDATNLALGNGALEP